MEEKFKHTILVVDDEEDEVAKAIEKIVETLGVEVACAAS